MLETELVKRLQIAISEIGARVFRNNVGVLKDHLGHRVAYGLCKGSSDLIGWLPITITPSMVGHRVAVFLAVEAKAEDGRTTQEQTAFLAAVQRAGGVALVARDVETTVERLSGGSE